MKLAAALLLPLLAADSSLPYRPGVVRGTVRVADPPPRAKVRMDVDPEAAALHPEPVLSEEVIADAEGRVQNAFVYVKRGLEGRSFPLPPAALIKYEKALLRPRIQGIRVGQDLKILNEDDLLHNCHAIGFNNKEFNFGLRRKGSQEVKKFCTPEVMVPLKCDIHPWERAYLGVLTHPFSTVTGPDGRYEIRDLPPGRYTIEVWQELYRPVSREIEMKGRHPAVVDVTLTRKK